MTSQQPVQPVPSDGEMSTGNPVTLPRTVVVMLGIIGAVAIGAAVKGAAGIVAPTMLALVLTIGVLPIEAWARRHRWPGWLGTLFALVMAYAIVAVLLVGTIICLIKLVDLLPQYTSDATNITDEAQSALKKMGVGTDKTSDLLSKLDPAKVASALASVLSGILGAIGGVFFLVTLMFFFVVAIPGFRPRTAWLRTTKPQLAESLTTFVHASQVYLVMTALFGAIVGVLDAGALWLIGIPLPLAWGFFSFITNFIPNIGFIIGIIPPALIALLDSGWETMLLVIVVYSVLNVTIQTFIQPRIVGNSVGLSAEITFMSLIVWAFLLGPLGALLAVPMTLLVRAIFLDADPRAAWAAPLIDAQVVGPEPDPVPDAEAEAPPRDPGQGGSHSGP